MTDDDENDETQTWEPEPPPDQLEREDPQEAIGYTAERPQVRHRPAQPPKLERKPIEVCSECGGEIVIRMFGECPHCQGRRNRVKADRMSEAVRALKADMPPGAEEERRLIREITELGHPDVRGLLKSLSERRAKGTATNNRRSNR